MAFSYDDLGSSFAASSPLVSGPLTQPPVKPTNLFAGGPADYQSPTGAATRVGLVSAVSQSDVVQAPRHVVESPGGVGHVVDVRG
jgi:hypothetical protein